MRPPRAPGDASLDSLGRHARSATLILASLAQSPKHGYVLTNDVEEMADVRLAPGTLYEALTRLEGLGLIRALPPEDRRKPYELTAAGAAALKSQLSAQRRVAEIGLRRLSTGWNT